jgi:hypothetical protein
MASHASERVGRVRGEGSCHEVVFLKEAGGFRMVAIRVVDEDAVHKFEIIRDAIAGEKRYANRRRTTVFLVSLGSSWPHLPIRTTVFTGSRVLINQDGVG